MGEDMDRVVEAMKALVIAYEAKKRPLNHNTVDALFKTYRAESATYNGAYRNYYIIKNKIHDPRLASKLAALERLVLRDT
jgi:hypothetical protein